MGISGREIAKKLKITHGSVQYNLKKSIQHGTVKNFAKCGRPRLINARKSRLLIRKSNERPKMTARQLQVELGLNKICSIDTVKRYWVCSALMLEIICKKNRIVFKEMHNCVFILF